MSSAASTISISQHTGTGQMARFAVTVIVDGDYTNVVHACRDVDHALTTRKPLLLGRVHDLLPGPLAYQGEPPGAPAYESPPGPLDGHV